MVVDDLVVAVLPFLLTEMHLSAAKSGRRAASNFLSHAQYRKPESSQYQGAIIYTSKGQ